MRVLVTGATGFIGALLVRHPDIDAVAASRSPGPTGRLAAWRGDWRQVDPADRAAMTTTLRTLRPDAVVHAAISRNADLAARSGREQEMAAAVRDAVEEAAVPLLVGFGSAAEYGDNEPPLCESMQPRPRTVHGVAKAAGVRTLLAEPGASRRVILRPFHVAGVGEPHGKLLPRAIAAAKGGEPLPIVSGGPVRDVVGVEDVVEGVVAALERPPGDGRPVNLCSGRGVRVTDVLAAVGRSVGRTVPVDGVHARTELDDEVRVGDPTRARQLWGWQASSLQATVDRAVEAWPWGAP